MDPQPRIQWDPQPSSLPEPLPPDPVARNSPEGIPTATHGSETMRDRDLRRRSQDWDRKQRPRVPQSADGGHGNSRNGEIPWRVPEFMPTENRTQVRPGNRGCARKVAAPRSEPASPPPDNRISGSQLGPANWGQPPTGIRLGRWTRVLFWGNQGALAKKMDNLQFFQDPTPPLCV